MKKEDMNDQKVSTTLHNIHHTLMVLSGKGGVGKSTISAHLALSLSKKGYKVGVLDGDLHGPSIPKIMGVEDQKPQFSPQGITPVSVSPNLKIMSMAFLLPDKETPIIWRGPMKMGALKQFIGDVTWGHLDYLIIDLPPGTGDEPLSIAQLIPDSDGAVIVTTPQDVALLSVRKSVNFVKKMNIPIIGIIENMSGFTCPHCKATTDIFKTGGGMKASEDFSIPFLGKIPLDPQIVKIGDAGTSFITHQDGLDTMASFQEIVENIEKNVNKKEVK